MRPAPASHNHVVFHDSSQWAAVPANNGGNGPTWQWGDELLVGFTVGTFATPPQGHQCSYTAPFESWLARSTDGGQTWQSWKPTPYAGEPGHTRSHARGLNLTGSGFVMRVEGNGYHGNHGCRWFFSEDRSRHWQGPFGFGELTTHPELTGRSFTGRTAYIVIDRHELLVFLSVRQRGATMPATRPAKTGLPAELSVQIEEKTFVARTTDAGRTFRFVSWVVPWSDPYRAVMPAPARLSSSDLVVALRRKSRTANWIDCYGSSDAGLTWSFLSRVTDTEMGNHFNGNPPSLLRMSDDRLCCVYGHRTERQMLARYSEDGRTWSAPRLLRDDFHSTNGWPDLGYARLFQRPDGRLVAVYFWCTRARPETHIESTVF